MLLHDHASSVTSGGATPVGVQSTSSRRDNGHDAGHRNHKGHNSARTQLHCGFSTCHSLPCASRPRSPRLRRRHLLLRCLFYEVGLDQHTRIRFCASLCPRGDRHGLHVQAPFVTNGARVNNGHTTGHRNAMPPPLSSRVRRWPWPADTYPTEQQATDRRYVSNGAAGHGPRRHRQGRDYNIGHAAIARERSGCRE